MSEVQLMSKEAGPTLLHTPSVGQPRMSQAQDNLSVFINNILFCCRLEEDGSLPETTEPFRQILKEQLNELWFEEPLLKLWLDSGAAEEQQSGQKQYVEKILELQELLRALVEQKNNASSESQFAVAQGESGKYMQKLQRIICSRSLRQGIDQFSFFDKEGEEQPNPKSQEIDIPGSHFFKELICTQIDYGTQVFKDVKPNNHQYYVMEAARCYQPIVPFRIKHIGMGPDAPLINTANYFQKSTEEQKMVVSYCVPGSKKVAFYCLNDITKISTITKDYYQERQLSNDWEFSSETKSIVLPNGRMFAIGCRSQSHQIDPYLYEITESKASNRGPLPLPRLQSSLVYLNGGLYLLGGSSQTEKCSRKCYRYDLKSKKWSQIAESNVALRKPTCCVVSNRYILKLGGLNEFDYINKVIELYDSVRNCWSLVRASPRNILEEVEILEDAHALQITDDQIFVFGGRNANRFQTDTGFVLLIAEIREKRKGAAKVSGEFWNVSLGKRNILTSFGQFNATSVLVQHNCIYGLRHRALTALAP